MSKAQASKILKAAGAKFDELEETDLLTENGETKQYTTTLENGTIFAVNAEQLEDKQALKELVNFAQKR